MRKGLVMVGLLVLAWAGQVLSAVPSVEIEGTIERWSPSDRIITLGGKEYRLAEHVRITGVTQPGRTQAVPIALRPGLTVLIEEVEGVVFRVVIQPRGESAPHQRGR